ncbi:MAG: hypothetical protein A3E01_15165 [Gammaproteobacteria bacterium RIFCSPHIGHO2_12_FULL_63_22]|nr:MAG: hypothetical protein A3E01_15165 [Gammaproteobacteria bacterium RIFCSPHIGHO2_12_FULL_63_22]
MLPDDELAAVLREANRIMHGGKSAVNYSANIPTPEQRERIRRRIFRRIAWERRAYVVAAFLAGFGAGLLA